MSYREMNIKAVFFSKTSTFTADAKYDVYGVNSSGGAVTVNLPAVATVPAGKTYTIKDTGGQASSNNITLDASGDQRIDGQTTFVISTNGGAVTIINDGAAWSVLNKYVTS